MSYKALFDRNAGTLFFYSPYNFLKDSDPERLVKETVIDVLISDIDKGILTVEEVAVGKSKYYFLVRFLKWDTEYFGRKIFRIEIVLRESEDISLLTSAFKKFIRTKISKDEYFYTIIPSEEIEVIQAITGSGFRLVETRLNYFLPGVSNLEVPRFPVRRANKDDILILREIASGIRNRFDRIHADSTFSQAHADKYLGTFIESSVNGFADLVIVPSLPGIEPFGFLAANKPVNVMDKRIAKLVLAAVDSRVQKGWLLRLLYEVISELKGYSTDYLTTITQSSNRPAIRTWEHAGFQLGFTTHVFSILKK